MPETITRTVRMDFTKVPRIAFDTPFPWNLYPIGVVGLELVGDNETVVSWASGRARVIGREGGLAERVGGIQKVIWRGWRLGLIAPRVPSADWSRHVSRELDKRADQLANFGLLRDSSRWIKWSHHFPRSQMAGVGCCCVACFVRWRLFLREGCHRMVSSGCYLVRSGVSTRLDRSS